jgi:dolichyl-diphosphooligosaccharide--protein glycosyltransferase
MEKEQPKQQIIFTSFKFTRKHMMVIAVLVIAFATAFMLRSLPLQYGFNLNEFDPYFDYRATQFLVDNGIDEYFAWHDTMSWYPEGRDVAATSQNGLHLTAAFLYNAFGFGAPLFDFVVWLPVVLGSFSAIVIFALVRVISGTTAGLFASLFFAVSPAIIQRGNLGWFKSEPLGLFLGLLATYLLLSALKHNDIRIALPKAVVGALFLALGMASWGGVQYFSLLLGLFFIAVPFFRKDRMPLYVIPTFAVIAVAAASAFPRVSSPTNPFPLTLAGLSLWIPAIVFLGVSYAIMMKSSERRRLRNLLAWLGAFIVGTGAFLAAGTYSASVRYISVINPFAKQEIPLVESVAEHFTPTIVDYFTNYSVLILLAGYGAMLCFRKRNDMTIFALILGITGIYVSASFSRMMLFSSTSIIILASIALYEITSAIFARTQAAPTEPKKKVKTQQPTGKDFRIAYVAIMVTMLAIPMFFPLQVSWVYASDLPPTIVNGATSFRTMSDDWPATLEWIKNNTTKNAVIASWWDYGYWITTLGERATLADNATLNFLKIEQIAKAFNSDEQTGVQILKDMQADYVLVYVVGQRVPLPDGTSFVLLGGGGDESKKHWFMRIAGVNEFKYIEDDGFTPTAAFWNSTLLGKMFPVTPAAYVQLNEQGGFADIQPEYRSGYVPLYAEDVKYPEDSEGPLRLVYTSPSFVNKNRNPMLAVMIYEIVKEYELKPKPVEEPKEEVKTVEPIPSDQYATLQTNYGNITLQLFPDIAPKTVENFQKLIDSGFYDGIKFHRIIPDFVIQAGDPNTKTEDKSTWGFGGPGYTIQAELSDLKHVRGVISMAHPGDPNKAGSQFFIVVKNAPHLDGKYSIFGKVVEGMDVVDAIVSQPRDSRDVPLEEIVIEKAYTFTK